MKAHVLNWRWFARTPTIAGNRPDSRRSSSITPGDSAPGVLSSTMAAARAVDVLVRYVLANVSGQAGVGSLSEDRTTGSSASVAASGSVVVPSEGSLLAALA